MTLGSSLVVFLLLWGQDSVRSVRLVELRVPATEREGGRALLGCQYDMEGEVLYSVKWYKDEHEFFRYVPRSYSRVMAFKQPGVYVDLTRSSNTVVAFENLTRESEGTYSCEVSGEGPSFNTTKGSKKIVIHLLPDSGPYVTGGQESYFLDEAVVMNCSSSASRPEAQLTWLLNGKTVPSAYLREPWRRNATGRPDAFETTRELRFIVAPRHFAGDAMRLTCQATIAPLYQRETESRHYIRLPSLMNEHGLLIGEPYDRQSSINYGQSNTQKPVSSHAAEIPIHSAVMSFLNIAFILIFSF